MGPDSKTAWQLMRWHDLAIAATGPREFFIRLGQYMNTLNEDPKLAARLDDKAQVEKNKLNPKQIDFEARKAASFWHPWEELRHLQQIMGEYDETIRAHLKRKRTTIPPEAIIASWHFLDHENIRERDDDSLNPHITRKKYQPFLETVHTQAAALIPTAGPSQLPAHIAGGGLAQVLIIGNRVTIKLADGRRVPISRALRTDSGPKNFIRHLFAHPNQTVPLADVVELDGCHAVKNLTELVRRCGFDRKLKAIFFENCTRATVNLRNEVQISAEDEQAIASRQIATNRD